MTFSVIVESHEVSVTSSIIIIAEKHQLLSGIVC